MQVLHTQSAGNTNPFSGDKLNNENWPVCNRTKYTYDALGNIKTKNEGTDTISISYDSSNLVDDVIINSTTKSYAHDAYGNVTGNGNQTFTYNLAGNMVTSSSPSITSYYDGHKRRVWVVEGSNDEYSMYGQSGTLLHKEDGGVETDYIYAGSLLVAKKEGSSVHYLHTDLLGSPIDGEVGSTSYTENYSPWGEKLDGPIQLADDVGYTGHQSDIATGFTYMQARYYDPVIGRLVATDPVGFDGSNPEHFGRYAYADNNPIINIDPDGREAWGFTVGGGGTSRVKGSVQYSVMLDSSGNLAIQETTEVGGGFGKGGGVFANVVMSSVDTVNDLEGGGVALSGSAGPFSASLSVAPSEDSNGITAEFGLSKGIGGPEGGLTATTTTTLAQTDILGRIGSAIGNKLADWTVSRNDEEMAEGETK